MERGSLSQAEFAGFAAKVVPYLNVMTRIKGHKDDDLLTKNGYSGHPTLAFMSPEGEVLGRPLDRSVESFEATLVAISDYAKLEARRAAGEKNLEYEFFMLEHKLSKLRGDALKSAGKALKGLTAEQQKIVDGIVLGVEVDDLVLASLGGPEAVAKAGERMLEILNSGKCPSMEADANAWSVLARYGAQIKDPALLERCSKGLRTNFADDQGMVRWADSLAEQARKLRVENGK